MKLGMGKRRLASSLGSLGSALIVLSFAPGGALAGTGHVSASTQFSFSPTGTATAKGGVSGVSSLSLTSAATVNGPVFRSGSSSLSFAHNGILTNPSSGQTSLTFTKNAVLTAKGTLAGSSILAFGTSLVSPSALPVGGGWDRVASPSYLAGKTVVDAPASLTDGTDRTATLVAAWNALSSNQALKLPSGTIHTNGSFTLASKTGCIMYGYGPNLTIIENAHSSQTAMIVSPPSTGCQFRDFKIYCPNTVAYGQPNNTGRTSATSGRGIHIERGVNVAIDNVWIDGPSGAGILVYRSTGTVISYCKAIWTKADSFHFTGLGSDNNEANHCMSVWSGDDAFASIGYQGNTVNNTRFFDNEVYDAWWASGCSFEGSTNGQAKRNKIYRTGIGGLRVASTWSYDTRSCDNIVLEDNYLEGCVTRTTSGHSSIYLTASTADSPVTNVAIKNCTVVTPASGSFVQVKASSATSYVSATMDNTALTGSNTAVTYLNPQYSTFLYQGRGNTKNGVAL